MAIIASTPSISIIERPTQLPVPLGFESSVEKNRQIVYSIFKLIHVSKPP